MSPHVIQYRFDFSDGNRETFDINLDSDTFERLDPVASPLPDWTVLGFHQCPNCPLSEADHSHCPLAVNLVEIAGKFDRIWSYDTMHMKVVTNERIVCQTTTAQRAISSMVGLLSAISGCPRTRYFKPMARFHLPLASEDDTLYRAAGMYLLAQYFKSSAGERGNLDLDGLMAVYEHVHTVNVHIVKRLRSATTMDSSVNAVVLLDMLTSTLPGRIRDQLGELQSLFAPYMEADEN